ncbi:hypothetical protein L218DRAFT_943617 [Marasmius fiardii PR-910]|nr:hypothetical protein L218DRAFT_943617 [Marasmius fiardii PR-910]
MFSRSPYYSYYPSYDDYYGYQNPYQNPYARAQVQAQAQAEEQRRALERQREIERRRRAALDAARRQQRASQYLPEASMMYPGRNRSYVPERASRYLPDEFDHHEAVLDDGHDDDAYDYGFGRNGPYWDGWQPTLTSQRERRSSKPATSHPQVQPQKAEQQQRRRSRSRSRGRPTSTQSKPQPPRSPPHQNEQRQSEPDVSKSSPSPFAMPQATPAAVDISSPSPSREEIEEAATKIQTTYRIHRALKTIETLCRRFDELKSSFTLPSILDFQIHTPEHHVSLPLRDVTPSIARDALKAAGIDVDTAERISIPKLAYTHTNVPVHGYVESLNQLLTSLDGVESYGEKRVREKRKEVVRKVEAEAGRIEDAWRQAWADWISALKQASDPLDDSQELEEVKSIVMLDSSAPSRDEEEVDMDEGFASASEDGPGRIVQIPAQ